MFVVVRRILNPHGVDHLANCGTFATRDEAEKSAQLFADAHNEIAGAAVFAVREMRVQTRATE